MEKYLIYAREECPYCRKLLDYMKENDKKFIYVLSYNLEENLHAIMDKYNWNTVPIVIKMEEGDERGELIGGCDDTIKYLERRRAGNNSLPDSRDN